MLSHKLLTRKDVGKLASYYQDTLDDYYAKTLDATRWQGEGARILGLQGEVDSQRFRELLAGFIDSEHQINRTSIRLDSKTRLGIDLTFSAPKSVSLQALIQGDKGIIKAHERAVQKAIEMAERRAQARQKIKGKTQIEMTNNLTVATFRHETSRAQDPQLHTHAIVLNLTKRRDGAWRALKNDDIIKSTRFLGAIYNAELAAGLQELGYNLRFGRDGNFELAHITRAQIEAFSQRYQEVEAHLVTQGLNRETATSAQKQQAALQSRKKKTVVDRITLYQTWKQQAKELDICFEKPIKDHSHSQEKFIPANEAAMQSVNYAIEHLTERQSIMFERELMDVALQHAVGRAQWVDIEKEVIRQIGCGELIREASLFCPAEEVDNGSRKSLTRADFIEELIKTGVNPPAAKAQINDAILLARLIQTETRYTTPLALNREEAILSMERGSRHTHMSIMTKERAHALLQQSDLNAAQVRAASVILSTTNGVVGVQGYAGTGKSHMLDKTKQLIEAQGFKVRALAPYGNQVKALQELNVCATTLASFIRAKEKGIDAQTVLIIDEAGVVPTRLMEKALCLAKAAGTRVVLLGDIAQTKAIEAGRPFHQLQASGMETALMDTIQRQKNVSLKKAVELAAVGASKDALEYLDNIVEIKDHQLRRSTIAKDYVKLSSEERERTIIVSGTNEARRDINKQVRIGLNIEGTGIVFDTLNRRDTTRAERIYAKHYRIGDVIQPERSYLHMGLIRGCLYRVEDTAVGNRLVVRELESQQVIEFNPMTYRKLSVYEPDRKELSTGDVVRITRNDKDLDVANGDHFKVAEISSDQVTLTNDERTITLDSNQPLHLDYAYATTVHSSQGLTADRVFIDVHAQSRTTAKDVFYVAVSRARMDAKIYTNDRASLPFAIGRDNKKFAALDMIQRRTFEK